MPLNLHTFPLVPYPGRAPELAPLSGMGHWEPYALLAPADRLLPFVLTRAAVTGGPAWVSCARIEHADTGALLVELVPTGRAGEGGGYPPTYPPVYPTPAAALEVVFAKYQEVAGVEHFAYLGALIPGMALPCGVPLRLVVDNAWQSPRFLARADLAQTCLHAQWWHDSPLYRVPYGAGFRQHLYLENAALQYATTVTKQEVSPDTSTGEERIDYMALVRAATVSTEAVPRYLAEALSATRAHKQFRLDEEAWKVTEAKDAVAGRDGGRSTFVLSLEQSDVLIRRACPAPLPVAVPFVPGNVRPWRCGVATDTGPDYQRTSDYVCLVDESGTNTGLAFFVERDMNPYSATYNTTQNGGSVDADGKCPIPFRSRITGAIVTRSNCPEGQTGQTLTYTLPAGQFTSLVSQADADVQAEAFLAANKQAYANANGTCTVAPSGPSYRPRYLDGGCFSEQMENPNDPNDVRDATPEEHDRYHRTSVNGLPCPE